MFRTMTRALVAMLAVAAFAAPSALARPGGPASAAADAARDATPPVYWSYEYEAPIPRPGHPSQKPHTVEVVKADDGLPWGLIAGLAGASLLIGGLATVTGTRVRASA